MDEVEIVRGRGVWLRHADHERLRAHGPSWAASREHLTPWEPQCGAR